MFSSTATPMLVNDIQHRKTTMTNNDVCIKTDSADGISNGSLCYCANDNIPLCYKMEALITVLNDTLERGRFYNVEGKTMSVMCRLERVDPKINKKDYSIATLQTAMVCGNIALVSLIPVSPVHAEVSQEFRSIVLKDMKTTVGSIIARPSGAFVERSSSSQI